MPSRIASTVAGFIKDGVPPPRKMLVTLRGPESWRNGHHLGQEGGYETWLVHALVADMAVEVAIGAFGRAERPVHIDAEARIHAVGQVAQARRCIMPQGRSPQRA